MASSEGEGKVKVTSHPSVKDAIVAKGWEYSDDRLVVDRKVITSRGSVVSLSIHVDSGRWRSYCGELTRL